MTFAVTTSNGITTRTYTFDNGKQYSIPVRGAMYCMACDGHEVPTHWEGKHYIYMYDWKNRHHDYYCFEEDLSFDVAPWDR